MCNYIHQTALTVHLSLIGEDDLPASTRRIDGKSLLEALFNIRAPHPLSIVVYRLVCRVAHPLHILGRALAAAPAAGINRGGWALQAEAWSKLGWDLEFTNKQAKTEWSLFSAEQLVSKKQYTTVLAENTVWSRSSQTSSSVSRNAVDVIYNGCYWIKRVNMFVDLWHFLLPEWQDKINYSSDKWCRLRLQMYPMPESKKKKH